MTKREVYEAMLEMAQNTGMDLGDKMTNDEVIEFFSNEISLLDKRAERSRVNAQKRKESGDPLMDTVRETLTEEYQTIADIAALIEGEEVTASKVTYRLNALVREGYAEKADVQIPASEGVKARVVKAYRIAPQA